MVQLAKIFLELSRALLRFLELAHVLIVHLVFGRESCGQQLAGFVQLQGLSPLAWEIGVGVIRSPLQWEIG